MTLFQFLRYVLATTPIALYDISGQVICKVQSKNDLNTDLLDYKIFRINTLQAKEYLTTSCYLCIMIQK